MAISPQDKNKVIDLGSLGKHLMAWHSQRPNIAYSETKIFDKYFEQIFKRDYSPERVLALQDWMRLIESKWTKDNPLGFNETLLAMTVSKPLLRFSSGRTSVFRHQRNSLAPRSAVAMRSMRLSWFKSAAIT